MSYITQNFLRWILKKKKTTESCISRIEHKLYTKNKTIENT